MKLILFLLPIKNIFRFVNLIFFKHLIMANIQYNIKSIKGIPIDILKDMENKNINQPVENKTIEILNIIHNNKISDIKILNFPSGELEIFKNLSHNNNYAISNLGRIQNLKTENFVIPNCIKSIEFVTLEIDEKISEVYILSNLVINTFNPIKDFTKFNVHHINGDTTDNNLSNLEWLPLSEYNHKDQILGDLRKEYWKDLIEFPIYQISSLGRVRHKNNKNFLTYAIRSSDFRVHVESDIKQNTISISKYMCLTFFSESADPEKKAFHKNGNICDNNINNLEYKWRNPYSIGPKIGIKIREEIKESRTEINIDYTNEIWLPILDFEGWMVSSFGRIKNLDYINELGLMVSGYRTINIKANGNEHRLQVHRLVLSAFHPIEKMQDFLVNHKDGNPGNNKLENLEWITSSGNTIHSIENGLIQPYSRKVVRIDLKTGEEKIYQSIIQASLDIGVCKSAIGNVLIGRSKTSGGYGWKNYEESNNKISDNIIPGERWKKISINNEETNYLISDYGRISNGKIIMKVSNDTGYSRLSISHKNKSQMLVIHKVVAQYFIGDKPINKDGKMIVVHHKDDNSLNNHYTNLEYITQSENVIISHGNGKTLKLKKDYGVI